MAQRIDGHDQANTAEGRSRELLTRGLGGDAAAYRAFLTELSTRLRGFFRRRMSGLPDEVEDLVQETLLAVHNQRHTYDPGQPLTAFRYRNLGNLATIGRASAIADLPHVQLKGLLGWLFWLFVHIFNLIGFRNRILVMIQWAWAYFTYDRAVRLITGGDAAQE